jgi:hypothetical protein
VSQLSYLIGKPILLAAHSYTTFLDSRFGVESRIREKVGDGWPTIRTLSTSIALQSGRLSREALPARHDDVNVLGVDLDAVGTAHRRCCCCEG